MADKIDFKYKKRRFSNRTTYRFLMFLDILFFVFCLTLIALYIIGNYQNFQDSSQKTILNVLAFSSIFTTLLSFILVIETIIKLITEHKKARGVFNLIYLIITIILSILCIAVSCAIDYISLGA